MSLAFSPDGNTLASGSFDQTIRIWDTQRWQELRLIRGNRDEVWSVAFSPDGKRLVSGAKDGAVKVWSPFDGGSPSNHLPPAPDWEMFALSPAGNRLLVLSTNRTCSVLELPSCREVAHKPLPSAPSNIVLAIGYPDGSIKVWPGITPGEPRIWRAHRDWINGMAFLPDGRTLATTDADSRLKLWDLVTGHETLLGRALNSMAGLGLNADASRLAAGSGEGENPVTRSNLMAVHPPSTRATADGASVHTVFAGHIGLVDSCPENPLQLTVHGLSKSAPDRRQGLFADASIGAD